jgi:hypothetical protein
MNALTAYITQKDAERDLFFCPCCKARLDRDDMDLANGWDHSLQMRAKYGAACCIACVDEHCWTEDGVLMRREETVLGYDGRWSSEEALEDAIDEASYHDADHAMYRGWV